MNAPHQTCASMVKHLGGGRFPYLLEYAVHNMTRSKPVLVIVPGAITRSQMCGGVAKGVCARSRVRVQIADGVGRQRYVLGVAHGKVYVSKRVSWTCPTEAILVRDREGQTHRNQCHSTRTTSFLKQIILGDFGWLDVCPLQQHRYLSFQ